MFLKNIKMFFREEVFVFLILSPDNKDVSHVVSYLYLGQRHSYLLLEASVY